MILKKLKEFKLFLIKEEIKKAFVLSVSLFFIFAIIAAFTEQKMIIFLSLIPFFLPIKLLLKNKFFFAIELEKRAKFLEGKIVTSLYYIEEPEEELKKEYIKNIENTLREVKINDIVKNNWVKESRFFIVSIFLFTFFLLLKPYDFAELIVTKIRVEKRIVFSPPPEIHFITEPFTFSAKIIGEDVEEAIVRTELNERKKDFKLKVLDNIVNFIYPPEEGLFKFQIIIPGYRTPVLKVKFLQPPRIKYIKIKEKEREIKGFYAEIKENTDIEIIAKISMKVDSTTVFTGDKKLIFKNTDVIKIPFKIKEDREFRFVHFIRNKEFPDPQTLFLKVLKEYKPFVKLLYPDSDIDIPENMKIPFIVYTYDDIGLDKVVIFVERERGNKALIKTIKKYKDRKKDTIIYTLNMEPLNPLVGEDMYVFFRVYDKDKRRKFSDSRKIKLHMPTFEEIYYKTQKGTEEIIEKLSPLKEDFKETFEKIRELKEKIKKGKISKREIRDIKETLEHVEREIEKSYEKLRRMEENIVSLDPEIHEKIEKISELMRELFEEELKEILKKLEEAIRSKDPEAIKKRLKELIKNQEIWKENLERTLSVLREIKKEYLLKKVIEKSKDVEKQLLEELRSPSPEGIKDALSDIKNIQQELDTLDKFFKDQKSINKDIQKAKEEGKEAMENLQSCASASIEKMKTFVQKSFQAVKNMRESLEKAYNKFRKASQNTIVKLIEKAFWGVMGFIKELEIEELEKRRLELILESYEKFREEINLEARKLIFFPKIVLREMGFAGFFLKESNSYIGMKNYHEAKLNLRTARSHLLKAGYYLLSFGQNMQGSQGSQAEFLKNLMRKLAQMIKEQSFLNEMTIPFTSIPSPQELSEEEKKILEELGKMQRDLAQELSKILEDMKKQGYGEKGLEKALEGAKEEMEEVAERLERRELEQEIRELQERILSRLLQAQKSIRKREFTQRRYAEKPKPFEIQPPSLLSFEEYFRLLESRKSIIENRFLTNEEKKLLLEYYEELEKTK